MAITGLSNCQIKRTCLFCLFFKQLLDTRAVIVFKVLGTQVIRPPPSISSLRAFLVLKLTLFNMIMASIRNQKIQKI
jgi:hypothetical protein